jgi:hypothetical protein
MVSWFDSSPRHQKVKMKKIKKEQFTVTTFTERGAIALKKTYERAGYKFVKSKVTPDKVFLTFEESSHDSSAL